MKNLFKSVLSATTILMMAFSPLVSFSPIVQAVTPTPVQLFYSSMEAPTFGPTYWSEWETEWSQTSNDKYCDNKSAVITDDTGANPDYITTVGIDTRGYQNLSLNFWYEIVDSLEPSDYIKAQWSTNNGSTWNDIHTYTNINSGNWTQAILTLPSGVENQSNLKIRFLANLIDNDVSHCGHGDNPPCDSGDKFRLDCVELTGETAPVCGNGVLESGEQCESPFDTCCDSSTCQFKSSSTVCRAATGTGCDVAESCTGLSATCPADAVQPNTYVCRGVAGPCDVAETCDGSTKNCPADAKSTAECRASAGDCDVAEVCDGQSNDCPTDAKAPNGTACGDGLFCTDPDTCQAGVCQGPARDCSDNLFCTVNERCDETSDQCVYDNKDCSGNDLLAIGTCDNTPDDAYHPTWDYRVAFTSVCDENADACADGNSIDVTNTCDVDNCDAECEGNADCDDSDHLTIDICSNECACEHQVIQCSTDDDCQPQCLEGSYLSGGTCDQETHTCSYSTENCDLKDGWYDTGNTQWVDTSQCAEKEQKEQEDRDYSCGGTGCEYQVTNTQWVDTDDTNNKDEGTSCDDGLWCSATDECDGNGNCVQATARDCSDNLFCTVNERCDETSDQCVYDNKDCFGNNLLAIGTCDNTPDDAYHPTWDYRVAFTSVCDENADACADGNSIDVTNTCDVEQCQAQCATNSDCESGKVCDNCTCVTPPPTCTDADQDGYYAQGGQCGPVDCNDANVNIYPGAAELCSDGLDNDCDGNTDCSDSNCTEDAACLVQPVAPPSGGGGGAFIYLTIFNETNGDVFSVTTIVSWFTSIPATSRVIYDTVPHDSLGSPPNYGYAFSTPEDSNKVTYHTVTITGLIPNTTYYWRAISHGSGEIWGQELVFTTLTPLPLLPPTPPEISPGGIVPTPPEITGGTETGGVPEEVVPPEEIIPLEEGGQVVTPPIEETVGEKEGAQAGLGMFLATVGDFFSMDNLCAIINLILVILIILGLLIALGRNKNLMRDKRLRILFICIAIVAIIILFFLQICWLNIISVLALIALIPLLRKKQSPLQL